MEVTHRHRNTNRHRQHKPIKEQQRMKACKEGVGGESKEGLLLKFKRANDFEPALQLNLSNYPEQCTCA